jgi:TonB family protein
MILAAAAALAAAQAPALAPRLGRDVTSRGEVYHPNVEFRLDHPRVPDPNLYRRVEQVAGAHLQAGTYPAAAFAARREGEVEVALTVDAAGRITGCTVTRPSGAASLDAAACPHLRRTARFHPALDSSGVRRGATVPARLGFHLHRQMHAPMFSPGPLEISTPAEPLTPLTLALIGIDGSVPQRPDARAIAGRLAVGADGRVTACTLYLGTWDDRRDKDICDRLRRDARYTPARDRQRNAIADVDEFWINWPARAQ